MAEEFVGISDSSDRQVTVTSGGALKVDLNGTSGGTITANQGTAGASAWPVKGAGTAGTADTGVLTVQGILGGSSVTVSGGVTAAQGTAAATASAWPIIVTDGTNTATVTALNAVRVAPGLISSLTTLNAVTANTTGTTVAVGSAYSNWTAIAVATGTPTAGTLTLELSQDQTNWVSSGSTASVTAAGNYLIVSTGKPSRFARVSLTGLVGTITLTVTMIAAG